MIQIPRWTKAPLNPKQETIEALVRKQGLEAGVGATALQGIRAHQQQEIKRVKAEDELAMKAMGAKIETDRGDDMGDVIIGDHSTYMEAPKNTFSQMAGKALLATAIAGPLGAVGWKYLDQPVVSPVENIDADTITEIGIYREPTP